MNGSIPVREVQFTDWTSVGTPVNILRLRRKREEIRLQEEERAKSTWLSANEAAEFLGISKSTLYKYTHYRKIPYYNPRGKMLRFLLADLNDFIRNSKVLSQEELDIIASDYMLAS